MTEGTRGGDKRPGSGPAEIEKLPTSRCAECGLVAVRAIVYDGRCRNAVACRKRVRNNAKADALEDQKQRGKR